MQPKMMKAAMYYGIGDIRIEEIPMPECPDDGLIMKVHYVTTCGTDVKTYKRGHVLHKPGEKRVFGHEGAGTVYQVGKNVTKFKVGDRIVVHDSAPCGNCYWCKRDQANVCENLQFFGGTWTEYLAVPALFVEKSTFIVPDDVPLEVAPAVEPMASATFCADLAGVRLGDYVVVNGAGPLGLGIIACISRLGGRVISCDKSAQRLELAKKMGAEWTIQITDGIDQVKAVRDLTPNGRGCDVAIEAVGLPEVWELTIPMVRKGGIIVLFGGCKAGTKISIDTALLHYHHLTIKGIFHTPPRHVEMSYDLIRRGVLSRDVLITGEYTLDNCVQALEDHYNQVGIKNLIKIAE